MRYGTQKPTGPWSMTLKIGEEPRCPGCAEFLQPSVTVFCNGWAWCQLCVNIALHAEPHLKFILQQDIMARHTYASHGLSFFTPYLPTNEPLNAHDFYEKWLTADHYALTDDGRKALDTQPVTQPPTSSTGYPQYDDHRRR